MEDLPKKILIRIFKFLPLSQLPELSFVCSKWHTLIQDEIGLEAHALSPPCFYPSQKYFPSCTQSVLGLSSIRVLTVGETNARGCTIHLKRRDLMARLTLVGRIARICFLSIFLKPLQNLTYLSVDICVFYHLRPPDLTVPELPSLKSLRLTCESVRYNNPFNDIRVDSQVAGFGALLGRKYPQLRSLSINYPHYQGMKGQNRRVFQAIINCLEENRSSLQRLWISNQDVYISLPQTDCPSVPDREERTHLMESLSEIYIDLDCLEDLRLWRVAFNRIVSLRLLCDMYLHVRDAYGLKRYSILPQCFKSNASTLQELDLTDLADFSESVTDSSGWEDPPQQQIKFEARGYNHSGKGDVFTKKRKVVYAQHLPPFHPRRRYQQRQTARLIRDAQFLDFSFLSSLGGLKVLKLDGGFTTLDQDRSFGALIICGLDKLASPLERIELRNLYIDRFDVRTLLSSTRFPALKSLSLINIGEYSDFGLDALDYLSLRQSPSKTLEELIVINGINWESWEFYTKYPRRSGDLPILYNVMGKEDKQIAIRLQGQEYKDFCLQTRRIASPRRRNRLPGESVPEFFEKKLGGIPPPQIDPNEGFDL